MGYNLENGIQFDELAPSLQQRLINLTTLYNTSHNGQVLKLDTINKQLVSDDNFLKCRVVSTLAELNQEKLTTSVDLTSVFSSWYPYAHGNNAALALLDNTNNTVPAEGQNLAVAPYNTFTTGKAWSYNSSTGLISNVGTENVVSGFITPIQDYNNYSITVKVDVGSDDDNAMIIVGYYKDSNGTEHTLSVVRGAGLYSGSTDALFLWGLIYDMGNSTQQMLVNMSTNVVPYDTASSTHNYVYLTVTREGPSITCKTSDYSSTGVNTTINDNLTFSYTMPTSKTNGMTDDMFNNLSSMLNYPSSVGFGARSLACTFTVLSQNGIWNLDYVYSLYDNLVYHYNTYSAAWETLGTLSTFLPSRILLYSSTFNSLYFYYYQGVYQKVTILPSNINATTLNGLSVSNDASGISHTWPYIPALNSSDGGMEIGRYLDFHYSSNENLDYLARIIVGQDGNLTFSDHSGSNWIDLDRIIGVLGSFTQYVNPYAGNLTIASTLIQYGTANVPDTTLATGYNLYFSKSFSNNNYAVIVLNAYSYYAYQAMRGGGDNADYYTAYIQFDWYINTATKYNDHLYIKFASGAPKNSINPIRYLIIGT